MNFKHCPNASCASDQEWPMEAENCDVCGVKLVEFTGDDTEVAR